MKIYNHALFPSIMIEGECPHFDLIKDSLINWIENYKRNTESVICTNMGGWQSPSDFWTQESFLKYFNYIFSCISTCLKIYNREFKISNMWININHPGSYNVEHDHPESILSGVLWVKVSDNCGGLKFNSPKSFSEHSLIETLDKDIQRQINYFSTFEFKNPREGVMVLFPSHIRHSVDFNRSNSDRISIAFNLI